MKASVLFGVGWENDSVEVLWRDAYAATQLRLLF